MIHSFRYPRLHRFVASVLAGRGDPTQLNRGRDTFAGYNIASIALVARKRSLAHCDVVARRH
jgi:hypothetical protein